MAGETSFTLTERDYLDASRDLSWRWSLGRGGAGLALRIVGASAVGGGILSLFDGPDPIRVAAYAIACALFGLAGVPVMLALCYVGLPRRSRRLFRQNKTLQHPVRYAWSPEGLGYETRSGSGALAWNELHRWVDGRHAFLFLPMDSLFYVLPKRVLSDAQAQDLRATVLASGLSSV